MTKISISSKANREVSNDILSITFSIVQMGYDSTVIQNIVKDAVTKSILKVKPFLKENEVSVQTGDISVRPTHKYDNNPDNCKYLGFASIIVKGTDTATISKLVNEIDLMTVSSTKNTLSFAIEQQVKEELTLEAINNFEKHANTVKDGFGFNKYTVENIDIRASNTTYRGTSGKTLSLGSEMESAESHLAIEGEKTTIAVLISGTIICE